MIKRYVCFDGDQAVFFNRHELDYPEPKRARRIRDKQRMKARARRVFAHVAENIPVGSRQAFMKANERLADNLAHCNKRCCNRVRDWEGQTLQERRFVEEMRITSSDWN